MIRRAALLIGLCSLATSVAAREPVFSLPLDCSLNETCFIQNYTDRDEGAGTADYRCGPRSYNGHRGTDFALPDAEAMRRGVDVFPAAPGRVRALRNDMVDYIARTETSPDVSGRECGNGVVIDHGGGWETQYCHMRQGSIGVEIGQRVGTQTILGQVGLSGLTEFAHLHLSVRRDGLVVDPFSPEPLTDCADPPANDLWRTPIPYNAGGLIGAGFAPGVPDIDTLRDSIASLTELTPQTPALVVWGFAYGGLPGDEMRLSLLAPDGDLRERTEVIERTRAQYFRAFGRTRPPGGWPAGDYSAEVLILRDGEVLSHEALMITLTTP